MAPTKKVTCRYRQPHPRTALLTAAVAFAAGLVAAESAPLAAGPQMQLSSGETNVEVYLGVDGLNPAESDPGFFGGFTVAYGVANRLTAYLGNAPRGDSLLLRRDHALRVGVASNVLDGPASVDLNLELRMDRPGTVTLPKPVAGMDLDLQLGSELPWGVYFRANMPLPGDLRDSGDVVEGLPLFEFTPGFYIDLGEDGGELYLEQDLLLQLPRERGTSLLANLGLAVGYTFDLSDEVQFASEIAAIPDSFEPRGFGFGAMVGFILSLPSHEEELRR